MTHDHDHAHHHGHSHEHSHDNGHSHDHSHTHSHASPQEMSLKEKLEKLVSHWIDHNDSHKQTFFTWADRAKDEGITTVADKIEKAGQLSEQVTSLLKDAQAELKK